MLEWRTESVGGRHKLHERECELEVLWASLRSAAAGDGGLLLVQGPAGIGKTSLLDRARQCAADSGVAVLSARGSVLAAPRAITTNLGFNTERSAPRQPGH